MLHHASPARNQLDTRFAETPVRAAVAAVTSPEVLEGVHPLVFAVLGRAVRKREAKRQVIPGGFV